MEENRKNAIYYQEKTHHRQQLRQLIKPQTLDMLEVNQNPSVISRKACQSVYHDQLQKQLRARNALKNDPNEQQVKNKLKSNSLFINNANKSLAENLIKFRDFQIQKDSKVKQYINLNYDGGAGFFKASQQHEKLRRLHLKQMGETLKAQLYEKNKVQSDSKNLKMLESQARLQSLYETNLIANQQKVYKNQAKQNYRNIYLKQIQQKKMKNDLNSRFEYNKQTRHNPITNPIQFHIENPYILKQIQQSHLNSKMR